MKIAFSERNTWSTIPIEKRKISKEKPLKNYSTDSQKDIQLHEGEETEITIKWKGNGRDSS